MTDGARFEAMLAELTREKVNARLADLSVTEALVKHDHAIQSILSRYLPLRVRRVARGWGRAGRGQARLTASGLVRYSTGTLGAWLFATEVLDGRFLPDDRER